jgi:hypothetical protein
MPRSFARRAAFVAVFAALSSVALVAHGDRIASLPTRGAAPLAERDAIKTATDAAAAGLGHVLVSSAEVLQGEAAAGPKAGTSEGCVAIGKATSADWVLDATLVSKEGASKEGAPKEGASKQGASKEEPGSGRRIELRACQVSTGRVETLARDLDPKGDTQQQIREVLGLLLRPEGVGDDPLPWERPAAKPAPTTPSAPSPPKPDERKTAAAVPRYGEGSRLAIGAGGGLLGVVARPDGARGSRLSPTWSIRGAYLLRPSIELTAQFSGLHGPGNALVGEIGGRFLHPIGRFALGAGASLGVLGQLGGARTARFVARITPTVAWVISRHVHLEVDLGALRAAPGEGGALIFAGAEAALLARF